MKSNASSALYGSIQKILASAWVEVAPSVNTASELPPKGRCSTQKALGRRCWYILRNR